MTYHRFLAESLVELAPKKAFVIDGEFSLNNITWGEDVSVSDIPTNQDIIDRCEKLQADYDALEYSRKRKSEYPIFGEQLDMLWHAIDSGKLDKTSDFYKTLKKIKDDNPKS
jgi:hypothetical protein